MGHESIDEHYGQALRDADVGELIASARRYIDARRLDDAQTALLAAGRLQPREGEIYRWLGEVLLRRGDAERAEKVLEKAVQFGSTTNATAILEHARSLIPTQQAAGPGAVADLFAQSPLSRAGRDDRTGPSVGARRLVPYDSEHDAATMIRQQDELRAQIDAVLSDAVDIPAPRSSRRFSQADEIALKAPTRALEFDLDPVLREPETIEAEVIESGAIVTGPFAPLTNEQAAPSSTRAQTQGGFTQRGSARALPDSVPDLMASKEPVLLENLPQPPIKLGGAAIPEARDVLDALEIAGVYEPDAVAVPQMFPWMRPEVVRSKKSIALLIALATSLLVGGVTAFVLVTNARARDHLQSEQVLAQVDKDLEQGDVKLLDPAEKSIALAFDLDSRSPHAALTWIHERVMLGLLKGGADIAFEDATSRAKEVGVPENKLAFAYVASFLFQGDVSGAASTVAKWDDKVKDDPWFHLIAGATFERAGDSRALERYSAAVKLAPDLLIAQILLTRAMAVDSDVRRAAELAKEIRTRHPQRLESAALVVLAWARDPSRGEPPAEAREVIEKSDSLPLALRAVPYAARAVLAIPKGMADEAHSSVQKGLSLADSPGMATWLGSIALMTGDEELARKAALAALNFSAAYSPARILAARVALFAARFDEALKATEDLPQTSPEVAIVTAAASYEKLDSERLGRAFDAISDDARKHPYVAALLHGQALLNGKLETFPSEAKALEHARDEAPWADLVSMDWALDSGEIDTAKKIAENWRGEPRAMRAIRLSRLARYENRLEDADKLSRIGLDGTPTMRAVTERVFTLVALKRDDDAKAVFKTYSNVGGPLAKWLRAYAAASHGKNDEAKAMVSTEDPPPNAAPMPARVIAAMAFGAMKNRKADDYVKAIEQAGFVSPDIVWAADRVGLPKLTPKKPK